MNRMVSDHYSVHCRWGYYGL